MLKYLNGCYSACMNSCGFYKQLTWLVSKSPLNPPPAPPSFHHHVSLHVCLRFLSRVAFRPLALRDVIQSLDTLSESRLWKSRFLVGGQWFAV